MQNKSEIMSTKVKAIPEGYHSITPALIVKNGTKAIEFYKQAFGATERYRMDGPNGKIGHAELKIGDSIIMLTDEFPEMKCLSPQSIGESPCEYVSICRRCRYDIQ